MSSAGSNDFIHRPLDTAENMRLKEDIIIQTLVGFCPNSYFIQFRAKAGDFLFSDHHICWMAQFQGNLLLFWSGDQFFRIILCGEKKVGGEKGGEGQTIWNKHKCLDHFCMKQVFCCYWGNIFNLGKKWKRPLEIILEALVHLWR